MLIVAVVGALTVRAVNSVHFIPATDAQIAAIVGEDLKPPTPSRAAVIPRSEIDVIASAADPVTDPEGANLPAIVDEERRSVQVTDAFERAAKGKIIGPDTGGSDKDWRPSSLERLAQLYQVQMLVEAVYDPSRCFKAACGAADYCALLDRSGLFTLSDSAYGEDHVLQERLLRRIEAAVASGVMSARQVRDIYARIEPAPRGDTGVADGIRRMFSQEFLPQLLQIQGQRDPDLLFKIVFQGSTDTRGLAAGDLDVRETLAEAAEVARAGIANTAVAWSRRNEKPAEELAKKIAGLPTLPDIKKTDGWFTRVLEKLKFQAIMRSIPNSLGRTMLRLFRITEDDLGKSVQRRTAQEAHRLTILLQLFRMLHHGALPAKLDELSSMDVSKSMPKDLFSGEPFCYSASRRVFWSVGVDGVDDRGNPVRDAVWNAP